MTDSRFPHQETPFGPSPTPAGDDLLPPVEPPSAGFIIQLFVIPALIVLVIVSVWLTFSWLVRRTSPEAMVQGLEGGPSVARWQRASELADMLRNKRFADFKRNASAADHLARILDRELEQAELGENQREEDVTLRYFLARALGEFEVTNGIGTLVEAATASDQPNNQLVRRGALEAIAVRAYNLRQLESPQELEHPDLMPALSSLARDTDPFTRSQAAYALGQIATEPALKLLEPMVDDAHQDTRYNAAVALAHRGNATGVETLAEMLDLEERLVASERTEDSSDSMHNAVVVVSALQAVESLAQQNSRADFSPVVESLTDLAAAPPEQLNQRQLPSRVVSDARRLLEMISMRAEPPVQPAT